MIEKESNNRLLVVDDSPTARALLSKKLFEHGLDVDTVSSAGEAIDYLYDKRPKAIFMDYQMPGMDGLQALKVIKGNPSTALIPVMMYTSQEGGLHIGQARALGAIGVLPKIMEYDELRTILANLNLLPGMENHASVERCKEITLRWKILRGTHMNSLNNRLWILICSPVTPSSLSQSPLITDTKIGRWRLFLSNMKTAGLLLKNPLMTNSSVLKSRSKKLLK